MRRVRLIFLFLMVMLSLLNFWCKENENNLARENKNKLITIEKNKDIKDGENINNKLSLTKFDKEIIKIAIKKGESMCKYLDKNKQNYCMELVKQQRQYLVNLDCNKMIVLTGECWDKKNFKNFDCDKIVDTLLRKRCFFLRSYQEAIKNHDKSFCEKLPRIKQKECYEKMK